MKRKELRAAPEIRPDLKKDYSIRLSPEQIRWAIIRRIDNYITSWNLLGFKPANYGLNQAIDPKTPAIDIPAYGVFIIEKGTVRDKDAEIETDTISVSYTKSYTVHSSSSVCPKELKLIDDLAQLQWDRNPPLKNEFKNFETWKAFAKQQYLDTPQPKDLPENTFFLQFNGLHPADRQLNKAKEIIAKSLETGRLLNSDATNPNFIVEGLRYYDLIKADPNASPEDYASWVYPDQAANKKDTLRRRLELIENAMANNNYLKYQTKI